MLRIGHASIEGGRKTVDITLAKIEYGTKSEADFFGQCQFANEKETLVSIKKLPDSYSEIVCEKENWRGVGTIYRNPNYNTFLYKGVFQLGDGSGVQKELRGVVGYFQIECMTGKAFNLIRQWTIVNKEATPTRTFLIKVNSETIASP